MKQVTRYQCECCGTYYNEDTKAAACEAFHVLPYSTPEYRYRPKNEGNESKYPYAVVVTMANGVKLTFKR